MKLFILLCLVANLAHAQSLGDIFNSIFGRRREPVRTDRRVLPPAKNYCAPLAVGESRVSNTHKQGPHFNFKFYGDYLLKRTSEDHYQVLLNLNFFDYGSKYSAAAMKQRVQGCFNDIQPYLKGQNGETLEVVILDQNEAVKLPADEQPGFWSVKLFNTEGTTNSQNYSDKSDCPTIAHEVMHIIGLADEYIETRQKSWNCRPLTHDVNLMNDLWTAYKVTVPRTLQCECDTLCKKIMNESSENAKAVYLGRDASEIIPPSWQMQWNDATGKYRHRCKPSNFRQVKRLDLEPDHATVLLQEDSSQFVLESRAISTYGYYGVHHLTCECDESDVTCRNIKKHVKKVIAANPRRATCPTYSLPRDTSTSKDEEYAVWNGPKVEPMVIGNKLHFTSGTAEESLLRPNHFRRILGGICRDESPEYFRCVDWTYKGDKDVLTCSAPEECRDSEYFLGVKDQ